MHGSGQNASCWSRVADRLRARGHEIAAPDLPKRAADWGLDDYAARIAESVQGPRSVVVAHSLCGAFLPLVPRHRPCGRLVYLAAVIPEPGKSIRQQFQEDASMFDPAWIAAGPRWFDESQRESLAREFLFHDADEETIGWALSTIENLDTARLVTEPAPFSAWPDVPAASIVASADRTLAPEWCRQRSLRMSPEGAIEIPTGHCPQVSRPDWLADLLERLG